MKPIRRIGLTGGIGAGKTTVAHLIRAAGIEVIDLDLVGRKLLDQPHLVNQVAALLKPFGDKLLNADGTLDRGAVRQIIFSRPEAKEALEQFLHPLIVGYFEARAKQLADAGTKLVVCEAALILETGYHRKLDGLIVVSAPDSMRRDRVMLRDSIDESLFDKIAKNQAEEKERQGAATHILYNDGDEDKIKNQVSALLESWTKKGWR